mmetsp:Transcript_67347/g.140710  ORF Transcript_67347/g.140710 Transcript_67347/m.140710 type:complete len:490 (-) Transcript_67347:74-1543(-)
MALVSSDGSDTWHPHMMSRPNRFNRRRTAGQQQPPIAAEPSHPQEASTAHQEVPCDTQQASADSAQNHDQENPSDMDWTNFAGFASGGREAQSSMLSKLAVLEEEGLPPLSADIPHTDLASTFIDSGKLPTLTTATTTAASRLSPAEWLGIDPLQEPPIPPDRGRREFEALVGAGRSPESCVEEEMPAGTAAPKESAAVETPPEPTATAIVVTRPPPGLEGELTRAQEVTDSAAMQFLERPSSSSGDVYMAMEKEMASPVTGAEAKDQAQEPASSSATKSKVEASSSASAATAAASAAAAAAAGASASSSTARPAANIQESDSLMALQALLPQFSEDVLRTALRDHRGDADATFEALLVAEEAAKTNQKKEKMQEIEGSKASGNVPPTSGGDFLGADSDKNPKKEGQQQLLHHEDQEEKEEKEEEPGPPPWLPMLRKTAKPAQTGRKTFYELQTERLKAALAAAASNSKPSSSSSGAFDFEKPRLGGGS